MVVCDQPMKGKPLNFKHDYEGHVLEGGGTFWRTHGWNWTLMRRGMWDSIDRSPWLHSHGVCSGVVFSPYGSEW